MIFNFVIPSLLLGVVVALLVMTVVGMRRVRNAQLLRLLAAFMRRGHPLEPSLAELSRYPSPAGEESLCRTLAVHLASGLMLPESLLRMKVLDAGQSAALSVAQSHGGTSFLLGELADEATRHERRALVKGALALYPLVVGFLVAATAYSASLMYLTYILPKFQQMNEDLGLAMPSDDVGGIEALLAAALFLWGCIAYGLTVGSLANQWWIRVPLLGEHLRMEREARLARALGRMLRAGATLEEAVAEARGAFAGGALGSRLARVESALRRGAPPAQAFREHGPWRLEFLWALGAITEGASPSLVFPEVAEVLEEKARVRFARIYQVATPVAVVLTAWGVGAVLWSVWKAMTDLAMGLMN